VQIKVLWLSVDPYMRGRMRDSKSYVPPFQVGEALVGGGVGRVERGGEGQALRCGQVVSGLLPWQLHAVVDVAQAQLRPLPDPFALPLSAALGVLGMPGMTAYFGFLVCLSLSLSLSLSDPFPSLTLSLSLSLSLPL
jgi:NADPH:quinone reductase